MPARHPDAERVGARGQARGDGDLARTRIRSCRTATCCCRTGRRWARATARSSSRASRCRSTELRDIEIVVPGRLTTAFLVLRMCLGRVRATASCRSTRSSTRSPSGRADAGLADPRGPAHLRGRGPAEGRRPRRVVAARDRPAAAARRRTSPAATSAPTSCPTLSDVLRESIQAGLDNRDEAMRTRMRLRARPRHGARRPLRRHVRQRAHVRLRRRGPAGRRELLSRAEALGAFEQPVKVEFVG